MKTAVFSTKSYDREYLNRFNSSHSHELTYFEAPLNKNTVNLTVGYEAVCVFVNDDLNKEVIDELSSKGVKVIALRCAGFNNVDLDEATNKGIAVVRVPTYSPQAVAEHAMALILTLNRKTHKAYNRIRESNFSLERLTGFDIHGKTVGIIGTGHIGALFAKIVLGFGCNVIGYDVNENKELVDAGVKYCGLDELFKNSDIISLHCPLIPATHHLLNKNAFDKMKDGVMVINTSRGALINTTDAIAALKSGRLGYLGIDVYEQEEKLFFKDLSEEIIEDDEISRLMTFPNVLITSHQGFFTKEALEEIASTTLKNLTDIEEGRGSKNEIKV
ncbi:2-hydroxyacid dehydrogenase [Mangrovivirga sp. M17]|uniref:2-hydroxyacid dehydrogenase n=1 Tax=Mangrovivirga halotolerans TaxID=2993936 RepID=A0ABT3RMF7_9BACT|nr:2-hydroxyacid dehydrogenase [Mangrovivirga halotolerans]MCX2742994.1 2-hydroxyacid dehydrogenase [Mangrovivirga halotolerans]